MQNNISTIFFFHRNEYRAKYFDQTTDIIFDVQSLNRKHKKFCILNFQQKATGIPNFFRFQNYTWHIGHSALLLTAGPAAKVKRDGLNHYYYMYIFTLNFVRFTKYLTL